MATYKYCRIFLYAVIVLVICFTGRGGLIIRVLFANEIWGLRFGIVFFGGEGGLLLEFFGIPLL